MSGADDPLASFAPYVGQWFRRAFGTPTAPQAQGWPVIARGEHALILAPTGSGKTLAAFLWSLDVLFREVQSPPATPHAGVRVLYVSPLKALNNDVERNLQVPLEGIRAEARRLGERLAPLRVAVRTGDTPSNARQAMVRQPPHILITTPESLYLMLTAERARAMFATTHTVIVDEIHTLVGTKRGAHLALSLERLEALVRDGGGGHGTSPGGARPRLQRIGLSATVRPLEHAARFLGGMDWRPADAGLPGAEGREPVGEPVPRPVTVVDAGYKKALDLRVVSVVDDFRNVPGKSIWSAIIPEVTRSIERHRTTLIFCNNRRLAERTADRLNERRLLEKLGLDRERDERDERDEAADGAPRRGAAIGADVGIFATGVDAGTLEAAGLQPIRAHHGSMSKEARLAMEGALKQGTLPALVATSSLELGIDVGEIDLVVQLQSPKSVSSGLQRVGRSGHLVGQTSVGRIFTTHAEDVMEAAAVAWGMLHGEIERTDTPENPLDILAQQLMAMVSSQDWEYDAAYRLVRQAYPYRNLSEAAFRAVVEMLAGKYGEGGAPGGAGQLQARLSWDRVNQRLAALPGSRRLAIQSGGTIPDRGTYAMVLGDRRTRVGELDEEFVFESRPGDTFLLGSQVWRVAEITDDRVIAEPAPGEIPRMPFWRGEYPWRPYDLGRRIGAFRRHLVDLLGALSPAELRQIHDLGEDVGLAMESAGGRDGQRLRELLHFLHVECGLDRNSIVHVVRYVKGQLDAVGQIATDRSVIVEVYEDALGDPRMVVHTPFGGRVNGPWAIALAGAIREQLGVEAQVITGDDGFLLRFAGEASEAAAAGTAAGLGRDFQPPAGAVARLTSGEARERLLAELPQSAVFGAQFRMNAARALLLPRQRAGKRTPLWLTRLRAKDLLQTVQRFQDFPILLETYRDCLRDVMDLDGLTAVLDGIRRGEIQVTIHEAEFPSPVAMGLDYRLAMQYVYEYDAPRGEKQLAALSLDRSLLADLLQDGSLAELLKPEAVAGVTSRVSHTAAESRARSAEELAQILYEMGDLSQEEIAARCAGGDGAETGEARARAWTDQLAAAGRIVRRRLGGEEERWVHAERLGEYDALAANPLPVLRRRLRYSGPTAARALSQRYGLDEGAVHAQLQTLGNEVVRGVFAPGAGEQWIDRRNLEQIHRRTLTLLRKEVQPVPLHAYAAFLQRWQGIGPQRPARADADGGDAATEGTLNRVLQQLRGVAVPGVAWERDVLPARLPAFDPGLLAERCQAGEVMWVAEGGRDPRRARVRFFFRGEGGVFLERRPPAEAIDGLSPPARTVYDFLAEEGAALLADVVDGTDLERPAVRQALVELVLAGLVTNDTLAALRAILGYTAPEAARPARQSSLERELARRLPYDVRRTSPLRLREARRRAREAAFMASQRAFTPLGRGGATGATGPTSGWIGRWSLVHRTGLLGKPLPEHERAMRQVRQLLTRWGVVTKACLEREAPALRWETLSPILNALEMRGEVRRGYFVEGLPGLQFALPEVVEQLRAVERQHGAGDATGDATDEPPTVLSAADPAQLFGTDDFGGPLRFPRVASAAVASHRGEPVAVMEVAEDGGASVDAVPGHPSLRPALRALARWWAPRLQGSLRLKVERWRGEPVLGGDGIVPLEGAGFARDSGAMLWLPLTP